MHERVRAPILGRQARSKLGEPHAVLALRLDRDELEQRLERPRRVAERLEPELGELAQKLRALGPVRRRIDLDLEHAHDVDRALLLAIAPLEQARRTFEHTRLTVRHRLRARRREREHAFEQRHGAGVVFTTREQVARERESGRRFTEIEPQSRDTSRQIAAFLGARRAEPHRQEID